MRKIYQETINAFTEAGDLHNENCCVNTEDCDVGVGEMECCDNMKYFDTQLKAFAEKLFDFVSHDMKPRDENQRKGIVEAYMELLTDE